MREAVLKGMEKGMEKARQEVKQERKRFIRAMLVLGNKPEQIAEQLGIPIELILEIQRELN